MVGNSEYAHAGRLPNPGNDAAAVSESLARLGFEVTTVLDADRAGLNEALRVFARQSSTADVAAVFYAGHGIEVDVWGKLEEVFGYPSCAPYFTYRPMPVVPAHVFVDFLATTR